jgi:ankyrin repeat protein
MAVSQGKANIIATLVKCGAQVNKCNPDGETPLFRAAQGHMKDVVEQLLEAKADPDICRPGDGTAALHTVCKSAKGNEDALAVIACLLDHKASPQLKDDKGWTPLHHSTEDLATCKLLIGSNGERAYLLAERNKYQSTPLVLAAELGSIKVMELFLEHGADPAVRNKSNSSALHRAAGGGHLAAVKLLIENKYKRVDPNIAKANGATSLHMAAVNGKVELVEYLVSLEGVDINAQSEVYGTPLCGTASVYAKRSFLSFGPDRPRRDLLQVCKTLMARGADVNATGGPRSSPLHVAAAWGQQNLAELLLDKQADIDIFSDENGTPLSSAIVSEKKDIVRFLLERGADPNIAFNGKVALQLAVETGDSDMIKILLKNAKVSLEGGEDALWAAIRKDMLDAVKALVEHGTISLTDTGEADGRTPLTYAITWQSSRVVEYLLEEAEEHGIDIDDRNKAGETAIHIAVREDEYDLVLKLLERGADPNTPNSTGKTASMLSAKRGSLHMLDALLTNGADVLQKDMLGRNTLDWACVSGSVAALSRVVAQMKEKSEWKECRSAALHRVLAAEKPTELLEVLLGDCDITEREAIFASAPADRNGWTLSYLMEHASPPLELPSWAEAGIRRARFSPFDTAKRPSGWDKLDKKYPLEVSEDGLTVEVGSGPIPSDEQQPSTLALIRSDFCIPAGQDYEFEISISAPDGMCKAGCAEFGVGLCTENAWEHHMVGTDSGSLGYHGSDGRKYVQAAWGLTYAEPYGGGDKIGCKIKVQPGGGRTVSLSKNKKSFGKKEPMSCFVSATVRSPD